tara:strand:+ start:3647 stop:4972 length:1326 start_codon:yes stop_codon:yes gene_type:complete
MQFKVGDKVRIKRGTRYESQSDKDGQIVCIEESGNIKVIFEEGYENVYESGDLELVEPPKPKKKIVLKKFLKETIFANGESEYNKVWESKEWFPLLKDKIDFVNERLTSMGVKRVICFDEIGEDWRDWIAKEELTLAVLPICNIINQNGTQTKELLKSREMIIKEKYMPIDIETSEEKVTAGFVVYFPTRNLIVTLVNPFVNEELMTTILLNISDTNPEFMDEKSIWKYKLEKQWVQVFEKQKITLKNDIDSQNNRIEEYRRNYFTRVQKLREQENDLVNLKKREVNVSAEIENELELIHKLPIIKDLTIRDKIYVNFGTINLMGQVQTGKTMEDGVEVPTLETKKVEIGELTFEIGNGEVKVKNNKPAGEYQHPHANRNTICFGEADLEIKRLLANLEIQKLIKLLYSWAFSYNESDAYTKLQTFYNKREEENADEHQEG